MKLDVRTNAKKGIKYGIIYRIITIVLPFIVQTVTIRFLGIEYAGIKGLYTSILTVLSLSELGVGTAIVFSMYKPIAEDDTKAIGALLGLYRRLYRIIGTVIFAVGIVLMPFLRYLVNGSYPDDINLQMVFMLFLINTVISYWMYAYKSALLNAYQRTDIISIVGIGVQTLTSLFQIVFLVLTRNFYTFLILAILFTIINNLVLSVCVDRMFPEIKAGGILSSSYKQRIRKDVAGIMIGKICATTRNSFDSVFMSMFLGLTQAAIYSNYFYVLSALTGTTNIVLQAILGGIGNRIVINSKEDNYKQMMTLHTIYMVISGWIAVFMLCLYQPFMKLWVGDNLVFPQSIMVLFPIYFYILKLGDVRGVYADAAGLFWENRNRTIVEAVANIVLNYIFVSLWGAFGIMLATIITLFFIGFIGSTLVIFKHYFKNGILKYLTYSMVYTIVSVAVGALTYLFCIRFSFDSCLGELLFRGLVCTVVPPFLFFILLFKLPGFNEALVWTKGILKKSS